MMKNTMLLLIFTLIVFTVLLWHFSRKAEVVSPQYVYCQQGDIVASISEKGRIKAKSETKVFARTEGQILNVPVKEGDWVKPGDPLICFDKEAILLKIKELTCQLQIKNMELEEIEQKLTIKKRLVAAGVIPQAEYADLASTYRTSAVQKDLLQTQMESQNLILHNLNCLAETTGQITVLYAEQGATVLPNTLLMEIIDPARLEVELWIKEFDAHNIKVNQKALITYTAQNQAKLVGYVRDVMPTIQKQGDAYLMKVTVAMRTPGVDLKPGNQVDVQIITGEAYKTTILPINVVQKEDEAYYVFLQTGNGRIKRNLKTGLQNQAQIEVLSGLTKDDKVVTND